MPPICPSSPPSHSYRQRQQQLESWPSHESPHNWKVVDNTQTPRTSRFPLPSLFIPGRSTMYVSGGGPPHGGEPRVEGQETSPRTGVFNGSGQEHYTFQQAPLGLQGNAREFVYSDSSEFQGHPKQQHPETTWEDEEVHASDISDHYSTVDIEETTDLTVNATSTPNPSSSVPTSSVTNPPPSAASAAPQPKHQPLKNVYGKPWTWDPVKRDYVQHREGYPPLLYTEYQRSGGIISQLNPQIPPQNTQKQPPWPVQKVNLPLRSPPPPSSQQGSAYSSQQATDEDDSDSCTSSDSEDSSVPPSPPKLLKLYQQPRDERFNKVDKPKRFYSAGRIFKTVWFEPQGEGGPPTGRKSDLEWTQAVQPAFYGEKPLARFRWFIVIRKRLHHSLCFCITTASSSSPAQGSGKPGNQNQNANKAGRGQDFVVLHSSSVEPPPPREDEGITRPPIAVIIEDGEQYISPLARLDISRIYTVEDSLRVMKVGRVHPEHLDRLEECFQECFK